ncbi:DUF674 domain-containing protein [Cinnamomum micranthum f. kanehirae]|uniref:DUF674 domain-containing protein n=1 Tax=Cinnamomum micranthum f. kanehirae TaxID=337451 RepID=A0A443P5K9_9MAGN|nr:DUF674 domain-containing protein [Cinnamomum micranthum f. kanehirae]
MVSKLKLRLFFKKKSGRVLFAEVEKDFVDFLLSLLTFPVGFFVEPGPKNPMFGCIGNLYTSIQNLKDSSIQTSRKKNKLLNPTTPFGRFFQNDAKGNSMKFYTCSDSRCRLCFTDFRGASCSKCKKTMTTECNYVVGDRASSSSVGGGYAVMDDLVLKLKRENSTVQLLRECGINNLGDVGESDVEVAEAEVLDMLRASLKSKTVLTDTFPSCGKKKA